MKRTLAISLLWASGIAVAQNPAVVQKNVQSAVNATAAAPTTTVSVKPSPTAVKAVPATASKTTVSTVKPAVVTAKPVAIQAKPTVAAQAAPAKTVSVPVAKKPTVVATPSVAVKTQPATSAVKPAVAVATAKSGVKGAPVAVKATPAVKVIAPATAKADPFKASKSQLATKVDLNKTSAKDDSSDKPAVAKSVGQAGRRDPFISPVVNMGAVGSGCSSGKRCLAIDQIALRGVVKSENGMIAVVVNATEKAYFLRENDPVFNGYVIKITGDSIVFKETVHDKLGKSLTRDITKTISRPVA